MARKLFDDEGSDLFSPLIDVVMGSLGAFFTLLVVYMILFHDTPLPIRFLQTELPPAIQGQNFIFTFPITGGKGKRKFEILGSLPKNLSFQSDSGTIYGVPETVGKNASQEFKFQIQVTDEEGQQDSRTATLTINPTMIPYDPDKTPLTIAQHENILKSGHIGLNYEDLIGAIGGVEPYVWEVSNGELPPGLKLENGYVRGIPEATGVFSFTVRVSHTSGTFNYNGTSYSWAAKSREKPYQVEILDQFEHRLELPPGRVQQTYLGGITITGTLSGERIVWKQIAPGLKSSDDGRLLLGIPTQSGTYSVTYEIHRDSSIIDQISGALVILPKLPEPSVGPAVFQAWLQESVQLSIPYRGLIEPIRQTTVSGKLPPNLRIENGMIVGIPTETGLFDITVTMIDGQGGSYQGKISIRVGSRF